MQDHSVTVAAMYEAFGKGDISAILNQMAENVEWEPPRDDTAQKAGVIWLQPRRGPKGVATFFEDLTQIEFSKFNVIAIMAAGNKVAVELQIAATIKTNGKSFEDDEMHLWTFNDAGKVIRFRHYLDTAKHTAAALAK